MPLKKSELYSSIWKSCDELRGGMDASQYKDYVLVLLFVKYVSDKYAGQKDSVIVVPKGGSFADMTALKGQKDIGDRMNKIISKLAEANDLKGVIDLTDFNDEDKLGKGKEMQERLSNLVAIFENPALDFSRNRAEGDDLLGDAYEYLMRHFATESGKSKGQFYTPSEVSIVMAKIIGISRSNSKSTTLYDPTCGSGSLLLKAANEAQNKVTIYGQEMDNATSALAKMNMILHDSPTATIWKDNVLSIPHFKNADGSLKTFDFVVANFPFSTKSWSNGFNPAEDLYKRFEDGMPPKKNGDYAFLLHILRSLKSTGKGAVILPHGVLFRGGTEGEIRKNIIRRGYIKAIIGLPANLFYGTGIPACIIVLDKENAAGRKGIFMINASKGFVKDASKNRLRHQDIHRIVDVFTRQLEIPKYSRMVPISEISDPKNDYNLNIPRYIDNTEEEDVQDIAAHLLGGIPERDIENLSAYWDVFKTLRGKLFVNGKRKGYSEIKVDAATIRQTIFSHPEFADFTKAMMARFNRWMKKNQPLLSTLKVGSHPKALIEALSEDLLATFADSHLIDPYDIYQHLMTYWTETMQDDVYMISSDGWKEACKLRLLIEDENKKVKEKADLTIGKLKYKTDLIPPNLLVARYFAEEQKQIENFSAEIESLTQQMDVVKEEHGGEEGLLYELIDEKGKISKNAVTKRLKEIKDDADAADERKALESYSALLEKEAELNKKVKETQKKLDETAAAQYTKLSVEEIKTLVIEDKWLTTLATDMDSQVQNIAFQLANRIKELAERYAVPLPELADEFENLTGKVDAHLKNMGFVWK